MLHVQLRKCPDLELARAPPPTLTGLVKVDGRDDGAVGGGLLVAQKGHLKGRGCSNGGGGVGWGARARARRRFEIDRDVLLGRRAIEAACKAPVSSTCPPGPSLTGAWYAPQQHHRTLGKLLAIAKDEHWQMLDHLCLEPHHVGRVQPEF